MSKLISKEVLVGTEEKPLLIKIVRIITKEELKKGIELGIYNPNNIITRGPIIPIKVE